MGNPFIILQISSMRDSKSFFSFEIKVGLVVTPSMTPISWAILISSGLAVSIKNFIISSLYKENSEKIPSALSRISGFFQKSHKNKVAGEKNLPPYFSSSSKGVPFLREGILTLPFYFWSDLLVSYCRQWAW